jgi:hypothetical protein
MGRDEKQVVAKKGPSENYLRLLRGEITPKAYADKVRKNVDRQIGREKRAAAS